MNKKLLEQLALAKEAGTKAMAKDFFAPTPGSGGADEAEPSAEEGAEMGADASAENLTPEQLEELLKMLGAEGGAQ